MHTTVPERMLVRNASSESSVRTWYNVLPVAVDCSHARDIFQGRTGPLQLPEFIAELAQQVMLGDTDAM